ncbi:MAG: hypothetical protein AB7E60_05830 [Sphingobium sp.]
MDHTDRTRFPNLGEDNSGQADSGTQANDVADDARVRATDLAEDSVRGGAPNPAQIIPDDTPDLVERMEGMARSGRIDNDAFADEPRMDGEEDPANVNPSAAETGGPDLPDKD